VKDGKSLPSQGIRVFPSIEAQSAYAHEQAPTGKPPRVWFFPHKGGNQEKAPINEEPNLEIQDGSVVFLMGPPGTFKERVAEEFARAAAKPPEGEKEGATLYLSFKVDFENVKENGKLRKLGSEWEKDENPEIKTYFFDARSPSLTPEEILFTIRNEIRHVPFRRAIVWGLRRLYDLPNFKDGEVQFLEALVTMLKWRKITTLLVDWPDKQTATTVPIVDLCQYILLTRVCHRMQESFTIKPKEKRDGLAPLWTSPPEYEQPPKQIAFLRVQRTPGGVRHDLGWVHKHMKPVGAEGLRVVRQTARESQPDVVPTPAAVPTPATVPPKKGFDGLWWDYGKKWEDDLSLQS